MGQYLDKLKRFDPAQSAAPQSHTVIEPASQNARPIYWESGDGRILGPAIPEFLARDGRTFWIVTTLEGQIRWINADQLRSKKAFEQQKPLRDVELIREVF
jgi:hypothetical protein